MRLRPAFVYMYVHGQVLRNIKCRITWHLNIRGRGRVSTGEDVSSHKFQHCFECYNNHGIIL